MADNYIYIVCRVTIGAHSKGLLFTSISHGFREQLKDELQGLETTLFHQVYNTGSSSDSDKKKKFFLEVLTMCHKSRKEKVKEQINT